VKNRTSVSGARTSPIGARDTIKQGVGSSLVQRRLHLSAQWSGARARRVQACGFSAPWRGRSSRAPLGHFSQRFGKSG